MALVSGLALCLSGCTKEVQVGPATVFAYAFWVPLAIIAAGAAGAVWGFRIRRNIAREKQQRELLPDLARESSTVFQKANERFQDFRGSFVAWWLLVAGPIVALIYGPSFFVDKVFVSNDRFSIQRGLWMLPHSDVEVFNALSKIELIREFRRNNPERSTDYLVVHFKRGGTNRFAVGDLLQRGALERILEVAQSQNIPVADNR